MALDAYRKRLRQLQNLKSFLENVFKEELRNQREFIAQLNREQLSKGERADGTNMPEYVEDSRQPSAPGPVTLLETGEFYEGIEPMFSESQFDLTSTDDKTPFLESKFGAIFGLTDESLQRLIDQVRERAIKRVQQEFN